MPLHRRPPSVRPVGVGRVALVVAAVSLLGGCATFTDADNAARVGDTSLTRSELDALIVSTTPGAEPDARLEVPLGAAQDQLNTWILTEILRGDLDAAGIEITDADRDLAVAGIEAIQGPDWDAMIDDPFRSLQIEQQAVLTRWSELDRSTPSTGELESAYRRGPEESGVTCVAHILVETADEADAVVSELRADRGFAEVAAERSVDPGSASVGGELPCAPTGEFAGTYIPEFVEAAFGAKIGEPTDPVASSFGFHVILLRPFDTLDPDVVAEIYDSPQARFRRSARVADVHVDPRYGAFDPSAGVVTLG